MIGGSSQPPTAANAEGLVESVLGELGTANTIHAWTATPATAAGLRALAHLPDLIGGDISSLDPDAAGLTLRVGSGDATRETGHHLLFDNATFATYLVYRGQPAGETLQVSLVLPVEGVPSIIDVMTGERSRASDYSRDQNTGRMRASVPLTGR